MYLTFAITFSIILASELMSLIYTAVEFVGGFAFIVLFISFILHKIRKANQPKVYETKVDKENELKMIVKDEKHNKVIVKGALSTKERKKKNNVSATPIKGRDKEIKRSVKKSSSSQKKNQKSKEFKLPKTKKNIPGRDNRIHIINKLSSSNKDTNLKKDNDSKKFYDI